MTGLEPAVPEPTSGKDGRFLVDFDTHVERFADEVVVTVLGEVDMACGPLLWRCLAEAIPDTARRLVVDLSGTTFIDSTGMALFVRAREQLRHRGAELILRNPQPSVRKVLSITGLDTVITIQDASLATTMASRPMGLRRSGHARSGAAEGCSS